MARVYSRAEKNDAATKGPGVDDFLLRQRTATRGRHVDWYVGTKLPHAVVHPSKAVRLDIP